MARERLIRPLRAVGLPPNEKARGEVDPPKAASPRSVVREDEQEINRMFNAHQLAGIRHEHNHLARGMHIERN